MQPDDRDDRGPARADAVARRITGLENASEALVGRLRLRATGWRERARCAGESCARARYYRVAPLKRHRDTREPRQSDRARAARLHAERRLRVLGIDPDAGSVHAD